MVLQFRDFYHGFSIWSLSLTPFFASLCISTLIFVSGGKGGCRACHMHLCQLGVQEVVVWTAFITSACHSEGSIFWARKSQEKLDTQIRAFPVAFFFPQARNTVRFTAFQQRRARFTAPQRCAYFTFCCCELGWRGSNSIRKAQRRRMPCPPVRQCWTSTLQ